MSQEPARDDRVAHGTHPRRVLLKLSGEVFGGGSIGLDPDVVSDAARQIADGSLGTFVNSHGGALVVHSVRDGVVEIAMEGACDHCPAAEITMHARFEHLLRRRCPWLVEVRRIDG